MSEIFAVAGLNESGQSSNPSDNEAGENASVCSSITWTPFSANTDHGVSCASNIPSPIMEEEAGLWMNIDHVDHMPEDLELDVKPCLDGNCLPNSTSDSCRQDSSYDDMFVCRLEELLQAGNPRELVGDSGHTCVDDLFPSLSTGQDSPLLDAVGMWSVESLQDLEPLPFQEEEVIQPEPSYYGGEEENVSQMFAQWLRSNAHCISLSDLRKIKLKTSTIENATRRLGGGKKGLMLFVKFVLMWVQNCHMKQAVAEAVASSAAAEATQPREASVGFLGASAVTSGALEGQDLVGSREGFGAAESCGVQSARSHPHTLYNGSTFSQLTIPSCTDNSWSTSKGRWTQTPNVEHNVAVPAANSFAAAATGGGCPLPFCRSEKPWLQQSSMLCGVSPSLRSPAVGANCLGASGSRDTAEMMMMMQQQQRRFDVTPAATTRAARKSRMERQRWSVRRNRKWSVAAHHLSSAASAPGADVNLPSWTAAHDLPYNSRTYQRLARSGMDCQQGKKSERNLRLLFHKELKQSDVGNLGRIVLPKKAAETSLPPLELRDGVNLVVEDLNSSKVWNMRYRFWPNNKSRMYLLENTGDFVKSYDLKEGDYMMLYRNNLTDKYMIRGAKGERPSGGGFHAASNEPDQNGGIEKRSPGGGAIALATNSEESCDDSFLAELIEQSLEDIKDSSETEMSDLLK